ncbi:unnamed protein product, partial [Staurois parvus]
VSCEWSQLVTWYKAIVNSLVPCDLCEHSQNSHIVNNNARSDILLTTLHGITDWPRVRAQAGPHSQSFGLRD